MARVLPTSQAPDDVDAVTDAVLAASRLLVTVSARSIAAVDDTITIPQFRLLVVLGSEGPQKLTSVAQALGVNPSTATRMVDRLVTAGLIDRQPNPASRRELVVALTRRGRTVVSNVTKRRRAQIEQIVGQMSPTSRRGLVRALSAFAAAGGESTGNTEIFWV
ncbi:MarR family winged helix-turn-helix transcriptional regulator [Kibdelosporangium persicum]|uniref:Multiple antibiotic resistance protein MarR n=1 Tax=Kibdelosporangium persicum TaxID=2698649 RepID=A0ABX2FGY3_9PSEU|nr:MarR family transcriptional regulator [Kibdelosporangium persicum]NRN70632.1 Multiple antibiotic resistance protein MarR [Kibdelosporangium persicum]